MPNKISIVKGPIHKPNITMKFTKLEKPKKGDLNFINNYNKFNNSINNSDKLIEPFEGVYKKNSRIIFFFLLILVAIIYMNY